MQFRVSVGTVVVRRLFGNRKLSYGVYVKNLHPSQAGEQLRIGDLIAFISGQPVASAKAGIIYKNDGLF